jgi:hypothetical protein
MVWSACSISILFVLAACGFVTDETLVGRYHLVAVDSRDEMSLCWSLDSGDCVGDGFPPPTLFAAGFNDNYVVVAVHPDEKKTIAQFYYIVREARYEKNQYGPHYKELVGPLPKNEYDMARRRLALPRFTRIFDDLK